MFSSFLFSEMLAFRDGLHSTPPCSDGEQSDTAALVTDT